MSKRPDAYQLALLSRTAAVGDAESLQELLDDCTFDRVKLNEALLSAAEHCSVASSHLLCIEALLQAGAAVHAATSTGTNLLMIACKQGQIQLVELALERGARVKDMDKAGKTALHYAVDTERGDNGDVVEMLIEHGADVNARDSEGKTALHYAAQGGLSSCLHVLLLQSNVLLGLQDHQHQTALSLAISSGNQACINCFHSKPAIKTTPKTDKRRPEDPGFCLVTGPEIGEELETGSGSSHSTGRNVVNEQGISTVDEGKYEEIVRKRQVDVKKKAMELKEIGEMRELKEEKIAIMRLERRYLEQEMECLTRFAGEVEKHYKASVTQYPSVLSLQRSPVTFSESSLFPSLAQDISLLMSEIEQWQSSLSPVVNRAIDMWRGLVWRIYPGTQVKLYGSFALGLHLPLSTIDLVVLRVPSNPLKALKKLEQACRLEQHMIGAVVDSNDFVPCLKVALVCDGVEVRLKVTVMDGRHRGLKCTEKMRNLLEEVANLKTVLLTVKQVFQHVEAAVTGLNSYALFLMVATFLKHENCDSPAKAFFRFLAYYGFECTYLKAISMDTHSDVTSEYPQLQVLDPILPQSNVASGADLGILTVRVM